MFQEQIYIHTHVHFDRSWKDFPRPLEVGAGISLFCLSQGRMKQREEPRFIGSNRLAFDSGSSPLLIA